MRSCLSPLFKLHDLLGHRILVSPFMHCFTNSSEWSLSISVFTVSVRLILSWLIIFKFLILRLTMHALPCIKGAQSRLNGLTSLAKLFNFVVSNPCQSSPSLTILVHLLFIIFSLVFFVKCYFQVSFNLTVILLMLKMNQNTVTEPL